MSQENKYRRHFPLFDHQPALVYLNSSAVNPLPRFSIEKLTQLLGQTVLLENRDNAFLSRKINQMIEITRRKILNFFSANEKLWFVFFTAGTTDWVNRLALLMLTDFFKEEDKVLVGQNDHQSVVYPFVWLSQLAKASKPKMRVWVRFYLNAENGLIDSRNFLSLVDSRTRLVILSLVNNSFGVINDLKWLINQTKIKINNSQEKLPLFCIDINQAVLRTKIDLESIGGDCYFFSGEKLLGLGGVGVVIVRKDRLKTLPVIFSGSGGGFEFSNNELSIKNLWQAQEVGTKNVLGIVSLLFGLEFIEKIGLETIIKKNYHLRDYFLAKLRQVKFLTLINEDTFVDSQRVGIFTLTLNERISLSDLGLFLKKNQILVRLDDLCQARPDKNSFLRVSLNFYNDFEDIDRFFEVFTNFFEKVGG